MDKNTHNNQICKKHNCELQEVEHPHCGDIMLECSRCWLDIIDSRSGLNSMG